MAQADPPPGPAGARAAVLLYRPASPAADVSDVNRELRQALVLRGLRVAPTPGGEHSTESAIDLALQARRAVQAHGGMAPEQRLMALGGLKELLAAGRAQVGQVELERAEATFADAERRLWEMALPVEATALLAEALRWRGVALWELHRVAEAEATFRQAQALAPATRLTTAEVRPEVVAAFERAEQALHAGGPLRLRVGVTVRGAAVPEELRAALIVTVDGVEVAVQGEREVWPGVHVVTAQLPGYQAAVQVLQLARGEDLTPGAADVHEVQLELRADPVYTALAALRSAPQPAGLLALCRELALSDVVLASPGWDAAHPVLLGQRYRCASAELSPVVVATPATQLIDRLWGAAAAVSGRGPGLLQHPLAQAPLAAPPPRRTTAAPPLFFDRPWPYIGSAILLGGVMLGVFLWPHAAGQTQVDLKPGAFP